MIRSFYIYNIMRLFRVHNNSYKLNFLNVVYKMAEMPCKYKGVNHLNGNHTFLELQFQKRISTFQDFGLGEFFYQILTEWSTFDIIHL